MLQFLQNKTFGNHPVPEGRLIVAAGNPRNITSPYGSLTSSPWTGSNTWKSKQNSLSGRITPEMPASIRHPFLSFSSPGAFLCYGSQCWTADILSQPAAGRICPVSFFLRISGRTGNRVPFQRIISGKRASPAVFSLYYRWYEKEKRPEAGRFSFRHAGYGFFCRSQRGTGHGFCRGTLRRRFPDGSFLRNIFEQWSAEKERLLKYRELFSDWHRQETALPFF